MQPVLPAAPSRRTVLRLALAAGAGLTLGACEGLPTTGDPAPTGQVVPEDPQTWPPDTELLVAARERVHRQLLRLDRVSGRAGRAGRRELEELWSAQLETLGAVVTAGGVPLPALPDALPATDDTRRTASPATDDTASTPPPATDDTRRTASPATDDTAGTSGAPRLSDRELGAALRDEVPAALADVVDATSAHRPLLLSLAAQHASAAARLGSAVAWAPLAGPVGAAAVELLAVTRPAVFGLEVLAARSAGDERARFEGVLTPLASLTRQLVDLAGEAAPVPPLGYDLPEPLDDADQRMTLARQLVADIAPAALTAGAQAAADVDQIGSLLRLVAEADGWRAVLGAAAVPFPGMTLP